MRTAVSAATTAASPAVAEAGAAWRPSWTASRRRATTWARSMPARSATAITRASRQAGSATMSSTARIASSVLPMPATPQITNTGSRSI